MQPIMKKLLLVIALLPLFLGEIQAQPYAYREHYASGENGIIREGKIAYYEVGGQGYFTHLQPTQATDNVLKIPIDWHVKDFRVSGTTVYFCGRDDTRGSALLGYFDASPLIAGQGSAKFYFDSTIGNEFLVLNRMAIDKDGALFAIGDDTGVDPDLSGANKAIYTETFPTQPAQIFQPANGELLWDVVRTGQYMALVGTIGLNSQEVTLHRFALNNYNDVMHRYAYQQQGWTFASGARATCLQNDDVAIALHIQNGNDHGTKVYTIDVQSTTMLANQKSYFSYYNSVPGYPPRDMAYMPDSDALMIVDCDPYLFYNGVVRLKAYPSSLYVAQYFVKYKRIQPPPASPAPNGWVVVRDYTSICLDNDGFLVASGDGWMRLALGVTTPSVLMQNNCIGSITTDLFVDNLITPSDSEGGTLSTYTVRISSKTAVVGCNQADNCHTLSEDFLNPIGTSESRNDKME